MHNASGVKPLAIQAIPILICFHFVDKIEYSFQKIKIHGISRR